MAYVFGMRGALVALGLAVLMPSAKADLIMTYDGHPPGQSQELSMFADGWYDPMPAGVFQFTINSGAAEAGFGPTIGTFCAEINQDALKGTPATYHVVPLIDLPDVQTIPPGFAALGTNPAIPLSQYPALKSGYLAELWGRYHDQTSTAAGAAAFQYSIWEILYEAPGSYSVSTGNVYFLPDDSGRNGLTVGSPTAALASSWLSSLTGDPSIFATNYPNQELVGLVSADAQDQIAIRGVPPVPAPASLALGLIGVGTLGLRLRRRLS